ncbi:MAG TPA: hypothetical protein VFC46_12220, partial [Humisphaera sp.]|nr:hypothetical protein [Humisphaera sp.]
MKHTLLKSFAAVILGASMASAADAPHAEQPAPPAPAPFTDPHWKKITMTRDFVSEGANFGDFNHDGKQDVVS